MHRGHGVRSADRWLSAQVPTRELSLAVLTAGRVAELLAAGPPPAPVEPSGIKESADLLEPQLRG
ncbi:hypothetical protein [uncultured Thiodictyon sp.]|uniref:hypothetical protein n=1 Tax=uncultured Thiodictyon sp. TaxID=1846217 RepID=UPI0025F9F3C6|nr:hypothetical protein [uncultured Thiodictyon sp.]